MTPKPQPPAKSQTSQRKWNHNLNRWKESKSIRALLFLYMAVLLFFLLAGQVLTETYDIELGSKSTHDMRAQKRMLNEAATEREREKAAREVQPVYTYVSTDNAALIDNIFAKLEWINPDTTYSTDEKIEFYRSFFSSEYDHHMEQLLRKHERDGMNDLLLAEVREQLSEQKHRIPEEMYFLFPRLLPDDLSEMKPVTKDIVRRLMTEPIRDTAAIRDRVPELVNASQLTKKTARELVQEITRFVITPNRFEDEVEFVQAVEDAKLNVQDVYIEAGELIVGQGQTITEEIYQMLDQYGMLKERANYGQHIGLLLMISLLVFLLYLFVRRSEHTISHNNVQLLMFMLIITINVLAMKIVSLGQNLDYPFIGFLAPVAMGSMLIAVLLEIRLAFIAAVIFGVVASMMYNTLAEPILFDYRYGFTATIVCFVSIFAIRKASQRSAILKAGISVSLFASLSIGSIFLLTGSMETLDVLFALSFAIASGIVTAVLVIGLLPFFEVSFGILSPLRLVELSNPNHPLLRKLLTETPGSYHHSVMVGNLAESAAEAIGADGLLCRVGSFYHDIGKTKRPSYFIENQGNIENPHDHIEPALSKAIIVAHAKDGADMLREHKMPKQICDIAEQHHGTTLLKYFYHKALRLNEEQGITEEILESDYRYPGPKAQSKEAAIVGIADCVEAAVRSLRNPTIEQIDSMVDKIIKERLEDDQFDECDLTLKELSTIGKALKETLLGIFHSRIEYPDFPKKEQTKAG